MKRSELQMLFFKEKGIECVNGQGEPDIDYMAWLENKICDPAIHMSKEAIQEMAEKEFPFDDFTGEERSAFISGLESGLSLIKPITSSQLLEIYREEKGKRK